MAINPVTGTRIQRGQGQQSQVGVVPATATPQPDTREAPFTQLRNAFQQGKAQLSEGIQGTIAAGQAALGFEDEARARLEEARRESEIAAQVYPTRVQRIEDIRWNQPEGLDDLGDYVSNLMGTQAPILGAMAAGSVLGGGVGALAGRAAAGTLAGVGASSAGLETGLIFSDIAADPDAEGTLQEQAGVSAIGGALAASLDVIPAFRAYRAMGKGNPLGRSLTHRVLREAGTQTLAEGSTEALQTVVERGAHNFVNKNFEILGPEGASEILNAAVGGAILGGGLGGLTAAMQRGGQTDEDVLDELDNEETLNRFKLERRVEGLRGYVPDEQLDAYLNSSVVDDELLDEVDALTPDDVRDALNLQWGSFIEDRAARDPLDAIQSLRADLESGNAERNGRTRRAQTALFGLIRDGLRGDGERRAATEQVLRDMNPQISKQFLVELDEEGLLSEDAAEDLEALGVSRVDQPFRSVSDFERQTGQGVFDDQDSYEGTGDFEGSPTSSGIEKIDPGFKDLYMSTSGTFYTTPESLIAKGLAKGKERSEIKTYGTIQDKIDELNRLDPNSTYEAVPARLVVEKEAERRFGPVDRGAQFSSSTEIDPVTGVAGQTSQTEVLSDRAAWEQAKISVAQAEDPKQDEFMVRLETDPEFRQAKLKQAKKLVEMGDSRGEKIAEFAELAQRARARDEWIEKKISRHAAFRGVPVNPENPMDVFEEEYAIQRIQSKRQATGEDTLAVDEEALQTSLSERTKQKRIQRRQAIKELGLSKTLETELLREVEADVHSDRNKERFVRFEGDKGKNERQIRISIDGKERVANVPQLVKRMVRQMRIAQSADVEVQGGKFETLGTTNEEIAQAFMSAMAALQSVPRALPPHDPARLEILEERNKDEAAALAELTAAKDKHNRAKQTIQNLVGRERLTQEQNNRIKALRDDLMSRKDRTQLIKLRNNRDEYRRAQMAEERERILASENERRNRGITPELTATGNNPFLVAVTREAQADQETLSQIEFVDVQIPDLDTIDTGLIILTDAEGKSLKTMSDILPYLRAAEFHQFLEAIRKKTQENLRTRGDVGVDETAYLQRALKSGLSKGRPPARLIQDIRQLRALKVAAVPSSKNTADMKRGMSYQMPAGSLRDDLNALYPNGTTTMQLIKDGHRTATSRPKFADVGTTVSFENDPQVYLVTAVEPINVGKLLRDPEARAVWEQREGWSLDYIESDSRLAAQVLGGRSVQTIFAPIFSLEQQQRLKSLEFQYRSFFRDLSPDERDYLQRRLAAVSTGGVDPESVPLSVVNTMQDWELGKSDQTVSDQQTLVSGFRANELQQAEGEVAGQESSVASYTQEVQRLNRELLFLSERRTELLSTQKERRKALIEFKEELRDSTPDAARTNVIRQQITRLEKTIDRDNTSISGLNLILEDPTNRNTFRPGYERLGSKQAEDASLFDASLEGPSSPDDVFEGILTGVRRFDTITKAQETWTIKQDSIQPLINRLSEFDSDQKVFSTEEGKTPDVTVRDLIDELEAGNYVAYAAAREFLRTEVLRSRVGLTEEANALKRKRGASVTTERKTKVPVPQVKLADGSRIAFSDSRLKREYYRKGLVQLQEELIPGGGIGYVYDVNGNIEGRTPSMNPSWFKDKGWTIKEVAPAVNRALTGKLMGHKQAEIVETMLDEMAQYFNSSTPEGAALIQEARDRRTKLRDIRKIAAPVRTAPSNVTRFPREPTRPHGVFRPSEAERKTEAEAKKAAKKRADLEDRAALLKQLKAEGRLIGEIEQVELTVREKKAGIDEAADKVLARVAELEKAQQRREWAQLLGRAKRYQTKLKMKGFRLANTINMVNILAKRGDLNRLNAILDGTQMGMTVGETVWVNPFIPIDAQLDILAHEMGHALASSTAPKDISSIMESWSKWSKKPITENARRTIKGMIEHFGSMSEFNLENLSREELEYVTSFDEWFADQVAEWLINENKRPKTKAEGWTNRFVNKMNTLFTAAKADDSLVDPSVEAFIENVIRSDTYAAAKVRLGGIKDARVLSHLVASNPGTQYANQALQAMIKAGWINGEPLNALARTFHANSAVNRQIQEALRPHSPSTAEEVATDWRKAVAYGYQLWAAGALNLGPATQTKFEKLRDWTMQTAYDISGFVPESVQAEFIARQVRDQIAELQRAQPDPNYDAILGYLIANPTTGIRSSFSVSQATRDTRMQRILQDNKWLWDNWLSRLIKVILNPAHRQMLATNNAALIELARRFFVGVGTEGRQESYLQARSGEIGRWQTVFANALGKKVDKQLAADLLDVMQKKAPASNYSQDVQEAAVRLRAAFDDIHKYGVQAGLNLGKRQDYFPWVYDIEQLIQRKDEWLDMMESSEYRPIMSRIFQQMQDEGVGDKLKKTFKSWAEIYEINSIRDLADYYHAQLVGDMGYADTATSKAVQLEKKNLSEKMYRQAQSAHSALRLDKTGHTPFMGALNSRGLNFLQDIGSAANKDKHQSFLSKDLNQILRVYTEQIVKRAEYNRRFKEGELEKLLNDATNLGASHEELQLAHDFVNAMQGTLGMRTNALVMRAIGSEAPRGQVINPKIQSGFAALILWQNLRTLALSAFTSLADPVGILVRGQGLDVAMASLKSAGNFIGKTDAHTNEVLDALGIVNTYAIDEALASTYGTNYMTGRTRLWSERFFHWNQLERVTRITRAAATGGALQFLKKHKTGNQRFLRELGVHADDIVFDANGNVKVLTQGEINQLWDAGNTAEVDRDKRIRGAIRRFVDESILRPNAATRPIWASDPHFQLLFHLKSFMVTFHDVILRRVFNEALQHGNIAPFLNLLIFIPIMLFADYMRDRFKHGGPDPRKESWDMGQWIWNAMERSGLLGMGMLIVDSNQDRQFGGLGVESLLGPLGSSVRDIDNMVLGPNRYKAFIKQLPGSNTLPVRSLADF